MEIERNLFLFHLFPKFAFECKKNGERVYRSTTSA